MLVYVPMLPLQGRPERAHLYRWISIEEDYVADKFDDQRQDHDDTLAQHDLSLFWRRQISQYLDRAEAFLSAAQNNEDPEERRQLELRAQQALVKCMMTTKGCVESSIRAWGPLPAPGVSSGEISPWEDVGCLS